MKHPSNRAERRHERKRVIARRQFVDLHIWRSRESPEHRENLRRTEMWGKYAKWNMNCGSIRCHELKYFSAKRRRRQALKHAGAEDLLGS